MELEVEDRPISSLSADELFAASLPRVPMPVQYEKMERFWERMGLSVVFMGLSPPARRRRPLCQ